jgi:hypothetical protein
MRLDRDVAVGGRMGGDAGGKRVGEESRSFVWKLGHGGGVDIRGDRGMGRDRPRY